MSRIDLRKCALCALLLVASLLTARTGLAAGIVLPNAYATVAGTCTYYVDASAPNDNNDGTTLANAWKTLSHAVAKMNTYYANPHPNSPVRVCIEPGDYYAPDYTPGGTKHPETSQSDSQGIMAPVLDVTVTATAAAPLSFTNDGTKAYPILHQSGYNGIFFEPGSAYITIYHVTVKGQAQNASKPTMALQLRTHSSTAWPFYDGNCISTFGNYPQGTPSYAAITAAIATHITILSSQAIQCGGGGIATVLSDYWTIEGNQVAQNSNWSIYLTSGISMLNDVDSDGSKPAYKNYIVNNEVTGNVEMLTGGTDGEGIIIDRNMNVKMPDYPGQPINNKSGQAVSPPAYGDNVSLGTGDITLIANNLVWNNGHAGIETFYSTNVDIFNNSTYGNATNISANGEVFLNYASQINLTNNVLYALTGSQPIAGNNYTNNVEKEKYYNGDNAGGNNTFFIQNNGGLNFPSPSVYVTYGYDVTGDPGYADPTPGSNWSAIDLTTKVGSVAAANGCVSGGAVCSSPTTDINNATRTTTPHPPDGAYAGTHN